MAYPDTPIILFDGVCNLCNGFVQFVIRHDKKGSFKFASLQSDYGASLPGLEAGVVNELSTVVLQDGDWFYFKLTAALRIARMLGFPFSLAYVFIILPVPLRNAIYDWIARNRYAWFGKREACWLPTPELKGRFLD
jgi:predicted DCC family thiol-disulfide oxidoreductase YuxK